MPNTDSLRLPCLVACCCILASIPLAARAEEPITNRARFNLYTRDVFGPLSLLSSGYSAMLNHLENQPAEWEQGAAGYGRRIASEVGRTAVQETIELGAGTLLHEDPRYRRKGTGSVLRRGWYALNSTLVYRTPEGAVRPAMARVGGIYGGAMVAAAAWYPDRYRATGDGVRMANIRLGTSAGMNLLREFWPDLKRIFKR